MFSSLGKDMASTMSCYATLDDRDYHVFKYARLRRSPEVAKKIYGIAMWVRFEGMPSYIFIYVNVVEIRTREEEKRNKTLPRSKRESLLIDG